MLKARFKTLLEDCGISQRQLAKGIGISPAALNEIINNDVWPKKADKTELQSAIRMQFRAAGGVESRCQNLFRKSRTTPGLKKAMKPVKAEEMKKEEPLMMLGKQELFPATKRHFNLRQNPFGEVCGPDDVFLSPEIRYVREAMYQTARAGGFVAVIGESGSGKSTLRRELVDRIIQSGQSIHIIEPYVLAMEDNDKTGKTLKSLHIAEAIMATVAPSEPIKSSPEARFRQVHKELRDSSRAGWAHCLIIEEAHGLPISTIKHLKRFLELEDGFKKLLSIILLGQSELTHKLSESNAQVREVVQRCEKIRLAPMNGSLAEFIKFRFTRVGVDADTIITPDAVEALRAKLTGPTSRASANDSVSLVYPLAVGNMITAALNLAAEIQAKNITPEILNQV